MQILKSKMREMRKQFEKCELIEPMLLLFFIHFKGTSREIIKNWRSETDFLQSYHANVSVLIRWSESVLA